MAQVRLRKKPGKAMSVRATISFALAQEMGTMLEMGVGGTISSGSTIWRHISVPRQESSEMEG